ncbi:ketoacyl-ACP synthase III [Paracoccaceae bacterium]|nr:ketoacyl-ACP synthase III [Paracoccaceae bacterium]
MKVKIKKICYHLPGFPRTNDEMKRDNPSWDMDKIVEKTGVISRYVSSENETALDLARKAGKKILEKSISIEKVKLLIFVTQSPDYILPTSACILQDELGLPKDCMAFDINLGCSGFVYALSVAGSLISSGLAEDGLIICADTYSKYILKNDRTNRPIFSDGAAAILVEKSEDDNLGPFSFGTDGSGFDSLIVKDGGSRNSHIAKAELVKPVLEMNGSEVFLFTMQVVPRCVKDVLFQSDLNIEDVDLFVFHQASKFVIDNLVRTLSLDPNKVFINYPEIGNTVSATIPIALCEAEMQGKLKSGDRVMLIGFGVGLSWGATLINWAGK